MEHTEHLAALRRDSTALLAAARRAGPSTRVPSCPAWTAVDLAYHIGEVHHFWGTIVAERAMGPDGITEPPRPDTDEAVFAFAEDQARMLDDVLSATDPATRVWTWSSEHDAAFVIRRMALETAVHRCDAERAAGHEHRLDARLSSDGVDEFLFHFLGWVQPGAVPVDGSVHLHCTDVEGEWLVTANSGGGDVVTREHAKGDAAVRGPAHDLLMVLWRRQSLDTVEVIGDRAVAERLIARTRLGTEP
jgi:uncharacterized protein (TIGR03083 family)